MSRQAKQQSVVARIGSSLVSFLRDTWFIWIFGFLFFFVLFRPMVVVGVSMEPTYSSGEILICNRHLYGEIERGDVVACSSDSYEGGKMLIKRVIGLPGEEIDIDFGTGAVYIDGVLIVEDYIAAPTMVNEGTEFPLRLGQDEYFVMGDNRNVSEDSRSPRIGPIQEEAIYGTVLFSKP